MSVNMLSMSSNRSPSNGAIFGTTLGLILLLTLGWMAAFYYAPIDANQGPVYRIMFLHVPAAFSAFLSAFLLFALSAFGLKTKSERLLLWSKATAEVGLLFTILTLATGSIWGRPTWGTWWTWDARLTTTFLMGLLYSGYLLLYAAMAPGPGRVRVCAVLGIIICINVPIIYQSVTWWRTLHQPPSLMRKGGPSMDPEIYRTLAFNAFVMLLWCLWLVRLRGRNLMLQDQIEAASFAQISTY